MKHRIHRRKPEFSLYNPCTKSCLKIDGSAGSYTVKVAPYKLVEVSV